MITRSPTRNPLIPFLERARVLIQNPNPSQTSGCKTRSSLWSPASARLGDVWDSGALHTEDPVSSGRPGVPLRMNGRAPRCHTVRSGPARLGFPRRSGLWTPLPDALPHICPVIVCGISVSVWPTAAVVSLPGRCHKARCLFPSNDFPHSCLITDTPKITSTRCNRTAVSEKGNYMLE